MPPHSYTPDKQTNEQATRRLLQTPSLMPFADEGEQQDGGEAHRMSSPLDDGQEEWGQEEDGPPQPQQPQQQFSQRTRRRNWRATPQQQHHHIASQFLEGADARLARLSSMGGGAAAGGGDGEDDGGDGGGDDVWYGVIVQGERQQESVEEFGEAT